MKLFAAIFLSLLTVFVKSVFSQNYILVENASENHWAKIKRGTKVGIETDSNVILFVRDPLIRGSKGVGPIAKKLVGEIFIKSISDTAIIFGDTKSDLVFSLSPSSIRSLYTGKQRDDRVRRYPLVLSFPIALIGVIFLSGGNNPYSWYFLGGAAALAGTSALLRGPTKVRRYDKISIVKRK